MRRGLLGNVSLVGGLTLLSRLLGFTRDILFAMHFGAGLGMDAFLVAFKIPNFMRRLFAEGAFSQAFIPVVSEYQARQSQAELRQLVAATTGALGLILVAITVVGIIAAPLLIWVFAPGFHHDPEKFRLAVHLLRFTFPYLLFISLTALAAGVLNSRGRFGPPAFAPILLNLALIGATLGLAHYFVHPVTALAIAVLCAGLLQLGLQLPFVAREKLLVWPRFDRYHAGMRRVGRLMLPAIFGSSVTQLNMLIDTLVASFLATGSVSWLYYSDRLMEFPLGVFAIALSTVILPGLSAHYAERDEARFSAMIDRSLRITMIIMPPAAAGLAALAGPIIATLFGHGAFNRHDVIMSRASLWAYAFGLVGFALVKVLAPAFFARQNTRTPVRAGVISVGVNLFLTVSMVLPWYFVGLVAPHAGLALATSVAAFVNAAQLLVVLVRSRIFQPAPGWLFLGIRVSFATAGMALVVLALTGPLSQWLEMTSLERALHLVSWLVGSGIVYLLLLFAGGFRWRQAWPEQVTIDRTL